MKKTLLKLAVLAVIAALGAALGGGCGNPAGGGGEGTPPPPASGSADDPISMVKSGDLSGGGWAALLAAIQAGGKYVALDLSACTGVTEFDPGTANTGESKIVSLVLPDTATSIKAGADYSTPTFRYFTALKSITGAEIETIGKYAFYYCITLETVSLPEAKTIDDHAFQWCTALTTVSLLEVTDIWQQAFLGCTALTSVSLPKVVSITSDTFSGCTALTSVSLPKVVNINGAYAFGGCTALTSVDLPATLINISANPFTGCINLTTINVHPDNPNYSAQDGMLLSKDGKTLIAFPAVGKINSGVVNLPEITTIAHFAFYNCTALTTVSLPETTTIGRAAFCNCTALTTVSLPKAATIGEIAFGVTGSQALTVTLGDTIPTLGIGMFDTYITGAKSVIVKVPDNTAWSGIIGGSFTGPENTGGTYWGEGFRGKGWESGAYGSGSAYGISSAVNENITLTIQAAP